jgi:hypothetical protein
METNLRASTNGAFMLTEEPKTELRHFNIGLGDFAEYDEKFEFPTRIAEVYSDSLSLVPLTATGLYSEYRTLAIQYGIPVLSWTQWLKGATDYIRQSALALKEQEAHS